MPAAGFINLILLLLFQLIMFLINSIFLFWCYRVEILNYECVLYCQGSPSTSGNDSFHRLPKKRKFDLSGFEFESTGINGGPSAISLAETQNIPTAIAAEQKQLNTSLPKSSTAVTTSSPSSSKIIQNYPLSSIITPNFGNSKPECLARNPSPTFSEPQYTSSHAPVIVTTVSHHSSNGSSEPSPPIHSHYTNSPFKHQQQQTSLLQIAHSYTAPNGNLNKPVGYSNFPTSLTIPPPESPQQHSHSHEQSNYISNSPHIHVSSGNHAHSFHSHPCNDEPMDLGPPRIIRNNSSISCNLDNFHNPIQQQQSSSKNFNSEMTRQIHDYHAYPRSPSPQETRYHNRAISNSQLQQSDSIQHTNALHRIHITKQPHQSYSPQSQSPYHGHVKVNIFIFVILFYYDFN